MLKQDPRFFRLHRYYVFAALLFTVASAQGQNAEDPSPSRVTQTQASQSTAGPQTGQLPLPPTKQPGVLAPGKTGQGEDKYIFGVLPNYRTAEMGAIGKPLTSKQKLTIATKDSFAWPLVGLGAAYALLYQAENTHPEFGQGVEGYAKRFGTSYCDQVDGNFMTEGIFPILLHQDPRYFRMAHGTKKRRTMYALTRILVTRTDAGKSTVNLSELLGNATSTAIGLSYYPDNRNAPDYLQNWGIQLGTDAVSQVLKEFWPDVKVWWHKKHHPEDQSMSEVPPAQRR
jgi:hypothetical protein